jgi:fimbrial chaperone protein
MMNDIQVIQTTRCLARTLWLRIMMLASLGMLLHGQAAAQLVIGPTLVEFGPKQKVAAVSVTLSSNAAMPMRLQADVLVWRQTVKGENVYDETTELLVTPPIAEIKPGQKQVFRLALRGARAVQEEVAYRLVFDDISATTGSIQVTPDTKVDLRMRYDLPVLLAPLSPVVNRMVWKPCKADTAPSASQAVACIHLLNAGNRRVKVQSVTIFGEGWQQPLAFGNGENILAGAEREWRIPLGASQSGSFRSLQVQTALGETLQLEPGEF